jgi:Flp pilus assembly pilin Flp
VRAADISCGIRIASVAGRQLRGKAKSGSVHHRFQDLLLSLYIRVRHGREGERGQTLGEYALLVSLIAVGTTLLAIIAFRDVLTNSFNAASNCLTSGC